MTVSAWLRADVTYAPVIAAKTELPVEGLESGIRAASDGSPSGGCDAGFGALALAALAAVALRKR